MNHIKFTVKISPNPQREPSITIAPTERAAWVC